MHVLLFIYQHTIMYMYQEPTSLPCHMYWVQGDSSFTVRIINPIKKLVKITKRWGYIPLIQSHKI
jgi:hypothetical protein